MSDPPPTYLSFYWPVQEVAQNPQLFVLFFKIMEANPNGPAS